MSVRKSVREMDMSSEAFNAVMALLAEYDGDHKKLVADAAAGRRKGSRETLRVISINARDVVDLEANNVISRQEARRYLRLRGSGPVTRRARAR